MNDSTVLLGVSEILRQGENLLSGLDNADYCTPVDAALGASIGEHYRHCLDHFQCLLDSLDDGEVNYDRRRRDPRVETDRDFAMRQTRRLLRDCESIESRWLQRTVMVRSKVSHGEEESSAMPSTLGREIMYVISHAIHHYALIGVMGGMLGVPLPSTFGIAPSTLQYQGEAAARRLQPTNGAEPAPLLVS